MIKVLPLLLLLPFLLSPVLAVNLTLYPSISSTNPIEIITNSTVATTFNPKIFENQLSCSAGGLYVLERTRANNQQLAKLTIDPPGLGMTFTCTPNTLPCPWVTSIIGDTITMSLMCPKQPTDNDYYNQISATLTTYTYPTPTTYNFSFMIDCDEGQRHKKFQLGYLIIAAINTVLIVGVALHSRFWSYSWKNAELGVEATWLRVLVTVLVIVGLVLTLAQFGGLNQAARVMGLVLGPIFFMMCMNEMFYLAKPLRRKVVGPIRLCDIGSFLTALALLLIAIISADFISNLILAAGIIISCIKLFKFVSLKEAAVCCAILMIVETATAVIYHYASPDQSYNDVFGRDIVSPILIQVPSFRKSLYKKCSWIAVTQIIFPGMTISYLRRFQFARQGRRPYLYTSNTAFFVSTVLWLFLQAVYQHTLPFALVAYPITFLTVMIIAHFCMNEFRVIWNGTWEDPEFRDNTDYRGLLRPEEQTEGLDEGLMDGMRASSIVSDRMSRSNPPEIEEEKGSK